MTTVYTGRSFSSMDANATRRTQRAYRLTITLATGETHALTVRKMPAHWKSHLMQSMPYGTVFQGATFTREAIS